MTYGPCPFRLLEWDCPTPGDGRKNRGHIWRISLKGGGVRCAMCGKKRKGRYVATTS